MQLTARDEDLSRTLARSLRVLSTEQIARTWFSSTKDPGSNAQRRVAKLVDAGVLSSQVVMAHPLLELQGPVVDWNPLKRSDSPNFGHISWLLQKRWNLPLKRIRIVQATNIANKHFGGLTGDRRLRLTEINHDLHLSEVYLKLRGICNSQSWRHESELLQSGWGRGGKLLPDAVIEPSGKVIEFGGAYSKVKLEEFHQAFRERQYQVW